MKHKFSHGRNIEHNSYTSIMRALQHSIIYVKLNHNSLLPNDVYSLVIEIIKLYINRDIIAVLMGIILSIIGNIFEHCSKA